MGANTKQSARDKVDNGRNNRDNGNGSVLIQADSDCYKQYHDKSNAKSNAKSNDHRTTVLSLKNRNEEAATVTTKEDIASNYATSPLPLHYYYSTTSEWLRRYGRKLVECLLVLSLPLRRAFHEDNDRLCKVGQLAIATTVIYGLLYALLVRYQEFLQPPLSKWKAEEHSNPKKDKENHQAALNSASAWRSRILSIANALILLIGSGLSFAEWNSRYNPESEGWVRSLPLSCDENGNGTAADCSCFSSHAITFTYLFVGYLQWDLCWIVWHKGTHPDIGSIVHHGLFILIASCICDGSMIYFRKPVAWLTLTELSTPFLNVRWYLAATDQKDTKLYCCMSLLFAGTFLSTRAVGYGLGLVDVWSSRPFWVDVPRLRGVVAGLHLVYVLNLVWSYKVGSALVRAIPGNNNKKKATTNATPRTKQE